MWKRWAAMWLAIVLVLMCLRMTGFIAQAEETTEIAASAYVLMEAETGTVLLSSAPEKQVSCGMMAKLMTALLTAEKLGSGDWTTETELTVGDVVSGTQGAVIWLTPGETMTVEDLLKGLIVGNANDAALVLAENISGSTDAFVMDMNARAFELGMRDTRFSSPQGDNSDAQYTTAHDLGLLCCTLAKMSVLIPYFQTWHDYLRGDATELVNENILARTDETSIGFKACHTEKDGWSIAAGASRQGMTCVAIALGCETDDERFAVAKSLLRRGFAGWKVVQPGFSAEFLYPVRVRGGVDRAVLIEPGNLKNLVVPSTCAELETVLVLPEFITAPVRKGQIVGTVAFYQGDTQLYETTVVAAQDVRKRNFWDAWEEILVELHEL